MQRDLLYFRRRQAEEMAAAAAAADPRVRAVHVELARRYGESIKSLADRNVELRLVSAA